MTNIEVKANREYILLGDISSSMDTVDEKCGNQTRYKYMLEQFKGFIKTACQFDQHGEIDIILFGTTIQVYEEVTLDKIDSTLSRVQPNGWTNLHDALEKAYDMHIEEKRNLKKEGKSHPGTVCLVFTDGEPTNRKAVQDIIVAIANHIDAEDEFNITILTVGSRSRELQEWLDKLHDVIEERLTKDFDIVHVERLEDVDFLGAVNVVNHD